MQLKKLLFLFQVQEVIFPIYQPIAPASRAKLGCWKTSLIPFGKFLTCETCILTRNSGVVSTSIGLRQNLDRMQNRGFWFIRFKMLFYLGHTADISEGHEIRLGRK